MHRGYVKLWRKLQDSFFYKDPEYVLLWIHILFKANHIDHSFIFNGQKMVCKRGQLIAGRKKLASETGIEESKVNRILKALKSEQQIEQQTNNRFSLITILNYEEYQGDNEQQPEQQMNNKRTTDEQQVNTLKELTITNKNEKNDNDSSIIFDELWNKYPKKLGRKYAYNHFVASVKSDVDLENINKALCNYLKSEIATKDNGKYMQHGSTWFNNWRDWINPTPLMMGKTIKKEVNYEPVHL